MNPQSRRQGSPCYVSAGLIALTMVSSGSTAAAQYSDWEAAEADSDAEQRQEGVPEGTEAQTGAPATGPTESAEPEPTAAPTTESDDAEGDTEVDGAAAPRGELPDRSGQIDAWLELPLFVGSFGRAMSSFDGFGTSPLFGGSFHVSDQIRLGAEMGLAFVAHSEVASGTVMEEGGAAFRFGNPLLFADWSFVEPEMQYQLGVGLTLPVLSVEGYAEGAAVALAVAQRGAADLWLWLPEHMVAVAYLEALWALGSALSVGLDAAAGLTFFVGDGSGGETEVPFQVAGSLEYGLTETMAVGVRAQMVYSGVVLVTRRDKVQLSLDPYGRFRIGEDELRVGLLVNLDAPFGFGLSSGKVWSLHGHYETHF